jgi:hypothetical protein
MRRTRINCRNGRRPKLVAKMRRSQVLSHIDTESRKRLGISGAAMMRQYRRGKLRDVGRVADLIVWSDILPEDDPIFEA